ncbi:MAG: GDSL family lipase [Lachnospiraceae bacterium]|nr:GDSL family lipase [Lachnospiraceae bacterium]
MKYHELREMSEYKLHGRTSPNRYPAPLFFNGSAVEVNVNGSELWIDIEVDFAGIEPWATIWFNGEMVSRLMLTKGRKKICLFRGMNPAAIKNIVFMRETQAMADDELCHLLVHGFEANGIFHSVAERKLKIEFVGDSITSGEGTYGNITETDWNPMFMGISLNYTVMIAKEFDAEFRCLSQSGWGVIAGWDNNPRRNIPAKYETVCGFAKGSVNEALGAAKPHDFAAWQPDVIVVNLGSNDNGAFEQPEWIDPVTKESFKLRMNNNGTYHPDDIARFEKAVIDFLYIIRKNNKKAYIIWAYGMVGQGLTFAISNAVYKYQTDANDMKTVFVQLPDTTNETVGSLLHPGEKSHRRAADVLIDCLRKVVG